MTHVALITLSVPSSLYPAFLPLSPPRVVVTPRATFTFLMRRLSCAHGLGLIGQRAKYITISIYHQLIVSDEKDGTTVLGSARVSTPRQLFPTRGVREETITLRVLWIR